jgi:protocatechuate 3,4-dioxygenase beta subunit
MKNLDFKLIPGGVIAGRVVDEDGEPVSWVQIQAVRYAYIQRGGKQLTPFGNATTDDRGLFRMHSIAPGKYYVSALYRSDMSMWGIDRSAGPQTNEGYATTYYPGTTDPVAAAAFEVAPGGEIQNVEIRLLKTRTARIRGKVTGGNPANLGPRTQIMLIPKTGMFSFRPGQAMVDAKGNFEIRGVSPGSYILRAEQFDPGGRLSCMIPIDVGEGNIEGLTLNLTSGTPLNGALKVADGKGDPGRVAVLLLPKDSPMMFSSGGPGQLKDDGTFTIPTTFAGTYEVNVNGLAEDFYVKSIRYGQEDALNKPLTLQGGSTGALEITVQSGAARLTGAVINEKKDPVRGATVVLEPASGDRKDLFKMATTDQNGTYSLAGLTPGDYRIYAFEDIEMGAYSDRDYLKEFERYGEKITVAERDAKTMELKLIPAEKVQAP